ncbi:MAG: cell wall metabolism sensor histidine kinase WalK [Defluviitaleaceae bacterium]|nr:cell wall metabolism sensor histidine kinase WalK [Defluviitaleaceae bacterium]
MILKRLNSIKIKLMAIYISVIFIIMAISGTYMLHQVRDLEERRAFDRQRQLAERVDFEVVQPNRRDDFRYADGWGDLQNLFEMQVVLKNELGQGIAPAEFDGWWANDRAVSWAMSGLEGTSTGRIGPDLHGNEVEWLSLAVPVEHPEGRVIIYVSMSAAYINENLTELMFILLLTAGIALLIVPLAWFFLADTLTKPIVLMARYMRRVNADELPTLPVKSKDEIGILTQNFNDMSEEIRRHLEEQSQLDNMRKEFVANVSHELRTPLTGIRTYTETLIDGAMEDPETSRAFLEIIDEEAKRMSALVTDLLELSRLDSNRKEAEQKEEIDVLGLLRLTVRQCQVLADAKSQTIIFEDSEAPCMIMANANRINQVMHNVLSNAIKYSPNDKTVHVRIETDDTHHRITVRDEGIGIPAESLARIFERFYRVDKARSRAMGGTGLGLAIAKEIMEEYGGTIRAESTPDVGTTMILSFKRAEPEGNDDPPEIRRVRYV